MVANSSDTFEYHSRAWEVSRVHGLKAGLYRTACTGAAAERNMRSESAPPAVNRSISRRAPRESLCSLCIPRLPSPSRCSRAWARHTPTAAARRAKDKATGRMCAPRNDKMDKEKAMGRNVRAQEARRAQGEGQGDRPRVRAEEGQDGQGEGRLPAHVHPRDQHPAILPAPQHRQRVRGGRRCPKPFRTISYRRAAARGAVQV